MEDLKARFGSDDPTGSARAYMKELSAAEKKEREDITVRLKSSVLIPGGGYIPTYTRTDLANNLHGSAGFRTDTQIVTKKAMRSIIAQTKKRDREDEGVE